MAHRIVGYENGKISCCEKQDCKSCDEKETCKMCCPAHFAEIKNLCDSGEIDGITVDDKNKKINCRGYCGYFQLFDGTEVYILPKVDEEDFGNGQQIFKNLVLNAYKIKNIKTGTNTQTDFNKNNLFIEILIHLFCKIMEILFKKGVKKFYSPEEDNLPYLKGKIKFSEHIKRNIVSKEKFYVEYDEFTDNIAENRILKTACKHLLKKINGLKDTQSEQKNNLREENKKLLRRFMQEFGDIEESKNLAKDFSKIQPNKMYQHYDKPLLYADAFLHNRNYWIKDGRKKFPALLFSLHDLFEDFIQHLLEEFSKEEYNLKYTYKPQYSPYYLLKDYSGENAKSLFRTKMDFVVWSRDNSRFLVLDAKYKIINLNKDINDATSDKEEEKDAEINYTNGKTHISQNDLYQVFTYSEIIKNNVRWGENKDQIPHVEIALLYPKNENFSAEELKDIVHFHYFNNTKISFIPIDLTGEDENEILENNKTVFKEFINNFLTK